MNDLQNPQTATSLNELCDILNEWVQAFVRSNEVTDYPDDLTSLPTFGGDSPIDTAEVWSWDEHSVLVSGPQITVEQSGWVIEPRCVVCGEATFRCDHDEGEVTEYPELADAIARLIAAAPDLLEACKNALAESIGQPSRRICAAGLDDLRAAIAKADAVEEQPAPVVPSELPADFNPLQPD